MKKAAAAKIALLFLIAAWVLSLGGCFDYTLEFNLENSGAGGVSVSVDAPFTLAPAGDGPWPQLLVWPPVKKKVSAKDGWITIKRTSRFNYLDELATYRISFKIERIGIGVLGMTSYSYRVNALLETSESDLPDREILPGFEQEMKPQDQAPLDPAQARAQALLNRGLAGRHITMCMTLPGKILKARGLVLGQTRIDPQIDPKTKTVTWRIPLSVMINENVRHLLDFQADFKGDLEFRLPGQTEIASHRPTPDELKSASGRAQQ